MNLDDLKETILLLPVSEREELLKKIKDSLDNRILSNESSSSYLLDNKLRSCPHCSANKYVRFGIYKGFLCLMIEKKSSKNK